MHYISQSFMFPSDNRICILPQKIDYLKARESELLIELDNILASYLSNRIELEKVNKKRKQF